MTIRFGSFDLSRMGAFAESPLDARYVKAKKESITPIIFLVPAIRQLPMQRWTAEGVGEDHIWTGPVTTLVGNPLYDDNPGLWHQDFKRLLVEIKRFMNFDWEESVLFKPNYKIWLWQPVHSSLADVSLLHLSALVGDPPYPRVDTSVDSIDNTDTDYLFGAQGGGDKPEIIDNIVQIPINTERLLLRKTYASVIEETLPAPGGMRVAMHYARVGETHIPGETTYWLSQPSLAELFINSMDDRPLDCSVREPNPNEPNRQVFLFVVRGYESPVNRFVDPFFSEDWRHPYDITPINRLKATIENYRSKEDPDCGGDGSVYIHVLPPPGSHHWLNTVMQLFRCHRKFPSSCTPGGQ